MDPADTSDAAAEPVLASEPGSGEPTAGPIALRPSSIARVALPPEAPKLSPELSAGGLAETVEARLPAQATRVVLPPEAPKSSPELAAGDAESIEDRTPVGKGLAETAEARLPARAAASPTAFLAPPQPGPPPGLAYGAVPEINRESIVTYPQPDGTFGASHWPYELGLVHPRPPEATEESRVPAPRSATRGTDEPRRRQRAGRDVRPKRSQGTPSAPGLPRGDMTEATDSTGAGNRADMSSNDDSSQAVPALRRNKWINRKVTRIASSGILERLLQTVHQHIGEMNDINLVTALHRVTKLAVKDSEAPRNAASLDQLLPHPTFVLLFDTVARRIEASVALDAECRASFAQSPFEVQCMSIVCWSCATLRLREERLLNVIAGVTLPRLKELKPFEISNMVWAFAKLSMDTTSFFIGISRLMQQRQLGEFSLKCLSMIVWSFATAKQRDAGLFTCLSAVFAENAPGAQPQEISNTLWAYAKSRCVATHMFNALADTALAGNMLWKFKVQELSNTVWAFATVNLAHAGLFRLVVPVAIEKRHELTPQNSANILWAYAKLQLCRNSGLFPALLSASAGKAPNHKPQEISAILWAAAREAEDDPACQRFWNAAAREGEVGQPQPPDFPGMGPTATASTDNGAGVEAVQDAINFVEILTQEGAERLHQFEPMALANLLRSVVLLSKQGVVSGVSPRGPKEQGRHLNALSTVGAHIAGRAGEMQGHDMIHLSKSLNLLSAETIGRTPGLVALQQVMRNSKARLRVSRPSEGRGAGRELPKRTAGTQGTQGKKQSDNDGSWEGEERFGGENPDELSDGGSCLAELSAVVNERCDSQLQAQTFAMPGMPASSSAWWTGPLEEGNFANDPQYWGVNQFFPVALGCGSLPPPLTWPASFPVPGGAATCGARPATSAGPAWETDPASAWGLASAWNTGGSPYSSSQCPTPTMGAAVSLTSPVTVPARVEVGGSRGAAGHVAWGDGQAETAGPLFPQTGVDQRAQTGDVPTTSLVDPQRTLAGPVPCTPKVWKPRELDSYCLVRLVDNAVPPAGQWVGVHLHEHTCVAVLGAGSDVVRLRCGALDERVVVKRMAAGTTAFPSALATAPHLLLPLARITQAGEPRDVGDCYLAFRHCRHGSLADWIASRHQQGSLLTASEAARVLRGVIAAVDALLGAGSSLESVCAEEMFVDESGEVHVRLLSDQQYRSHAHLPVQPTGAAAKWFSPEEAMGQPTGWPAAAFRLGLLLYCMGAGTTNPYPFKGGGLVFLDLKKEVAGASKPVRPDLSRYVMEARLSELMQACWMPQASSRPRRSQIIELCASIHEGDRWQV